MWCVFFFAVFCFVSNKRKPLWQKIAVGVSLSLLYTVAVFCANNFWRYIEINAVPHRVFYIPYGRVLIWDITYTYSYGEYRYVAVFGVLLLLCGVRLVLSHPRVKAALHGLSDRFWDWGFSNVADDTEELAFSPSQDEAEKRALMKRIDRSGDGLLLHLLFVRFGDILTAEEYAWYRARYTETVFAKLDAKFHETNGG